MTETKASSERYVAFYGSLMRGLDGIETLGIGSGLRYLGPCQLTGQLYDLGPYPGLRAGPGRVVGELHALLDETLLDVLDAFEGYVPGDPDGSLYQRARVPLLEPAGALAWTYFYNAEPDPTARIASGDWRAWLAARPPS